MNTVAFRPLKDRYLILPDEDKVESETIGNITLSGPPPDPHKRSFEGTVVALGKSCVELEIGDKAVYGEFSGYEQTVDGVKYLVLQEAEILGQHLLTPFDDKPTLPFVPSLTNGPGQASMEKRQIIGTIDLRGTGGASLPLGSFAVSSEPTHILTVTEAPPEQVPPYADDLPF